MPTDQQIADSQELVISVFKSLREELLQSFGNIENTQKADSSPVTVLDVKVETTLSTALAKSFPEMGFEGEETGKSGNVMTYWLVDPIDGTSSFIRGLAGCTNMAALVHNGVVIAAVIYDFVNDVLYTARKGQGAYKDGKRITVKTTRHEKNLVVYSLGRKNFGKIFTELEKVGIRAALPMGAAGNAYVLLAEGKIDGVLVVHAPMGIYDNAPGMLIAEEAGADVLQYDDKTGVYRQEFIVGSPLVVSLVKQANVF